MVVCAVDSLTIQEGKPNGQPFVWKSTNVSTDTDRQTAMPYTVINRRKNRDR